MAKIVFMDEVAYKPYSPEVLRTQWLGGSEASVVRVAEKLAKEHAVFVASATRQSVEDFSASYVPLSFLKKIPQPDAVVAFRHPKTLKRARSMFPNARLWLWMEDSCLR